MMGCMPVMLLGSVVVVLLLGACRAEPEVKSPLEYSIREELPKDTLVGNVAINSGLNRLYNSATLKQLSYRFLTQPELDRSYVAIEKDTGIIRTTSKIDRDLICRQKVDCFLEFDVAVSPVKYFTIIKVILEIIDVNDNPPMFPQREMTFEISESTVPGTTFAIPAATDLDSSHNGIQEYDIVATSSKFTLKVTGTADGNTDLRLVLKEALDRENIEHYQVRIIAYDGGRPRKSGSVLIDISVQDANDNDPQFENATYEVHVTENIPVGSAIARVKARDPDQGINGDIVYKFTRHSIQEYSSLFGINSDTGEVFVRDNLDFEKGKIYLLSIVAHDRGADSLPATASLVVRVLDMNDNPPQIKINTLTTTGEAQVLENAKVGTFVAHISVIDEDTGENGIFSCTITNENFELQKLYLVSEYKLVTKRVFDREGRDSYTVPLVCKDRGLQPQTSVVNIPVKVVDENDHPPVFWPRRYSAILEENNPVGAYILKVNATDADIGPNGKINFRLDANAGELVSVEPNSGLITAAIIFDYERIQNFEFLVYAVDGGTPPNTATATVHMTILDHDDEQPKFSEESYSFGVYENQEAGADVGRVIAVDADNPPFNSFFYTLDPYHSAVDTFEIDRDTGVIYTKKKLDREGQPVYYLTVIADPGNNIMFSSTASVSIYVADKNDNDPVFDFPTVENNTVKISSQTPVGYHLTRLRAHDIDTAANAKLTYGLVEGNRGNTFTVDPVTGEVDVNTDLSDIVLEEFFLKVVVRDNGEHEREDFEDLVIVVSKDIAFTQYRSSISLEGDSLIIVLACVLGTLLIGTIFIIAIIIIIRTRNREHRNGIVSDKEMQKMLPTGTMLDDGKGTPPPNTYVTSKDMEQVKNHINRQTVHQQQQQLFQQQQQQQQQQVQQQLHHHQNHHNHQQHQRQDTPSPPLQLSSSSTMMPNAVVDDDHQIIIRELSASEVDNLPLPPANWTNSNITYPPSRPNSPQMPPAPRHGGPRGQQHGDSWHALNGTLEGRRASQVDHDSLSTNSDSGRGPSSEEGEHKHPQQHPSQQPSATPLQEHNNDGSMSTGTESSLPNGKARPVKSFMTSKNRLLPNTSASHVRLPPANTAAGQSKLRSQSPSSMTSTTADQQRQSSKAVAMAAVAAVENGILRNKHNRSPQRVILSAKNTSAPSTDCHVQFIPSSTSNGKIQNGGNNGRAEHYEDYPSRHRDSTISGEYIHYDCVDSNV